MRLGLIGDNIRLSQSPRLHVLAGRLCGLRVVYEPLIPVESGLAFDAVFEGCRQGGYRGVNITYPYKERVVARLTVADPIIRRIAACNTAVFDEAGAHGFNTDYTGFVSAFREAFGNASPGIVAMAGAGGVGKAVGFALGSLGAAGLRIVDPDRSKAEALAVALTSASGGMAVDIATSIAAAASGANGLVNCTPLGMDGKPGTAIPRSVIGGQDWAFDAVYTPVTTEFLRDARAAGLAILSGYELFFHQGVNAFRIFTGRDVDEAELRRLLAAPQ